MRDRQPQLTHIHPRARRLGALLALAALVALCFITALTSSAAADGGSQQIQMDITQCDPSDSSGCSQTSETVAPRPKQQQAPAVTVVTVPSQPKPAAEVHKLSLKTGKDKVQTTSGAQTEETVKLDSKLKEELKNEPASGTPPALPPVSTVGGSAPSGFAGFDFVSGDEALARFAIPPFLLPIYVSAGRAYNVPWNVLAAINSIETDFGRVSHQVSSAGAIGWMQFMPGSWQRWGVDASGDGYADPYNPVDAIYAAARYLHAAGGSADLSTAIFAYNHADSYVAEVLKTAGIYGSLPPELVGETSTLAYGRFPVLGRASYGDDFRAAQLAHRTPRGLTIQAKSGAPAIATQQVTVERILLARSLAKALVQKGALPEVGVAPAAPAPVSTTPAAVLHDVPLAPTAVAKAGLIGELITGKPLALPLAKAASVISPARAARATATARVARVSSRQVKHNVRTKSMPAHYGVTRSRGITVIVRDAAGDRYSYSGLARLRNDIRPGALLNGGQVIGTMPRGRGATLTFAVKAAGGSQVDPRPLVDGYRLQEATDFFHAVPLAGANPFLPGHSAAVAHGHYVAPLPPSVHWTPGRVDMGWDIETGSAGVGQPLLAIGDAQILHIQDMGGFGPTWITYRLLDGAAAGRTIFIGHAGPPLVKSGQIVRAGQPIIRIHGGTYGGPPGHFEIGWANPDGSNTLAAPHYSEGDVTPEGASFQNFMSELPGTFLGAAFPDGLGALKPQKVSAAQERKLSRELDRVVNPHVSQKPSPDAVKVSRGPAVGIAATKAMHVAASAAGASLVDVSVPADARGDEAYALGTVDGTGTYGWAKRQLVVLKRSAGRWNIVGAPRAQGHVVNPRLHALAAVSGGYGYAVGDRGAVALLRGERAPIMLARVTRARLRDVAVRRVERRVRAIRPSRTQKVRLRAAGAISYMGRLSGYAVGDHATVIRLDRKRQSATRLARGSLADVDLEPDGTAFAAGWAPTGDPLLYERSGSWHRVSAKLRFAQGATARLTSVAYGADGLWVAGGLADGGVGGAERPFAAHLGASHWTTYCTSSPALARVVELGTPSDRMCAGVLPADARALGAATALATARQGVVVATPGGLALYRNHSFRPVPDTAGLGGTSAVDAYSRLSLSSGGTGWAVAGTGRLARITPAGGQSRGVGSTAPQRLPLAGGGKPVALALAGDGAHALAAAGGDSAAATGPAWKAAASSGVTLARLALTPDGDGWAIASNVGTLLRFQDGKWTVPGDGNDVLTGLRATLIARLGGESLPTSGDAGAMPGGLRALSFAPSGLGYAVGEGGVLASFRDGRWHVDSTGSGATFHDVAAADNGVVAGGDRGTLFEGASGIWVSRPEASKLVGGQDFTAVDALADGTRLAAAGGVIIERAANAKSWSRAPFAPLGGSVDKMRAYRDAQGALHALALVRYGQTSVLLDGSTRGWRAATDDARMAVSDFDLERGSGATWVTGTHAGDALVARLGRASAPTLARRTSGAAGKNG